MSDTRATENAAERRLGVPYLTTHATYPACNYTFSWVAT
jgi:hypothetical protein